jgi:uncharacterized membrane protein YbaN (DUF454 family)
MLEESNILMEAVITEKSSATLHTMVEERHQFQQQLVHLQHQNPSKRHKTIYLVQKSKCTNSPKEARTHCAQNAQANTTLIAHCAQDARLSTRKSTHFS